MSDIVILSVPGGAHQPVVPSGDNTPDLRFYATGSDLESYIASLNLIAPSSLPDVLNRMNCAGKAKAAADWWEETVSWKPYLAGYDPSNDAYGAINPAAQIRHFDPPGPNIRHWSRGGGHKLYLRGGLIRLDQVRSSVLLPQPQNLNATPMVLNQNFHFFAKDLNGDVNCLAKNNPIEMLEFVYRQWGAQGTIEITGVWGKTAKLRHHVWMAVRNYGAYLAFQELASNISRGLVSRKDLNTQVQFATGKQSPLMAEGAEWQKQAIALAMIEQRIAV